MAFSFEKGNDDEKLISEINITPLVDVMLILMIIFLITAPLMINNLNIKLPKAVGSSDTKSINKTIMIAETGEISFEKREMSLEQLANELKQINDKNNIVIKIASHHNAPYQYIASVLSVLSKNNISNISFLTEN